MSRIVSVWLRSWPIVRLLRAQASAAPADAAIDPNLPLVLVAPGQGGARIVSLNRAARESGLAAGELLSNARSKVLDLQCRDADPAADAAVLRKLALWCLRYTPVAAACDEASGADGLFLDVTGCTHLLGGEAELLADLARRLSAFGLYPRAAIADTAGAAWAMARHGPVRPAGSRIVPPGGQRAALRDLPLAALRLSPASLALMRRLGFRRIGEIMPQPRAPFAVRFEPEVLSRLDQALGREPEPLVPVVAPPAYHARAHFLEPILAEEHVLGAATRLLRQLAEDLERDGVGARVLRLVLFQMDGEMQSLDIGLAAPSRDAEHIAQLIGLRLYRLGRTLEADFGFEAAAVHVLVAEPFSERQDTLGLDEEAAAPEALGRLIDRLQQRLGMSAVCRLSPHQSHTPERASSPSPRLPSGSPHTRPAHILPEGLRGEGRGLPSAKAGGEGRRHTRRSKSVAAPHPSPLPTEEWGEGAPRPLLMLPQPEAAEVVALIPEGPPRQFRWRGVLHQVAEAQGPERIAPEWWRRPGEAARDYYVVEDADGRRFWLYRAGLYGRDEGIPRWFVHGVFG
jgi:protein ImuB